MNRNDNGRDGGRDTSDGGSKIVWSRHKQFTREIDRGKYRETLAVLVSLSDHHPFRRASFKMGVLKERDGEVELFPFINPFCTNMHLGTPNVDESLLIIAGLMQEAHEWLKEFAAMESARYVEMKKREETVASNDDADVEEEVIAKPIPKRRTGAPRASGKRASPDAEPIRQGVND